MPETGSTFGDWFAPATDAAWRAAWDEARNLGHAWFGTEHLLLGLLHGPADDPAVRALATRGVTLENARAALVADLHGPLPGDDAALLATLGVNLAEVRTRIEASLGPDAIDELYDRRRRGGRRLARGPLCGIGMMPRAKLALEQARRAANTEHRPLATTTDLLLGTLEVHDDSSWCVMPDRDALCPRGGDPARHPGDRSNLVERVIDVTVDPSNPGHSRRSRWHQASRLLSQRGSRTSVCLLLGARE